jgi:glycosyltransferase involved in cell wall biosynthesis
MNRHGQTVCLSMIVRNEAHVIRRCLESVRPLVDFWVIVDTGSSDGTQQLTREIFKDIPGELIERPWKNFGHNRTEALELARGRADYLLFIDADDVLEIDDGFELAHLSADSYTVEIRLHHTHYRRRQLLNNQLRWRYEGVLHEYVYCPEARTEVALHGIHTRAYLEGARSRDPRKYRRDALLLEQALIEEPDNSRHVFYLAQSYRDDGDSEAALRNYRRRIQMAGWSEEVWYSMLQVATLRQALGHPWGEVMQEYLRAFQYRPHRAEPIFQIGLYYQGQREYATAHLFFSRAMAIPYPAEDGLFIDAEIYRCRMPLEYAVSCHYVGDLQSAIAVNRSLLHDAPLSPRLYDLVVQNQRYSLAALQAPSVSAGESMGLALVGVPLHNPGVEFDELVESLLWQTGDRWRVVFLDTGSDVDHACRIPADDARFHWLRCEPSESWRSRLAALAAEDPVDLLVLLPPGHRLLDPHALDQLRRAFVDPHCALAHGRARTADGGVDPSDLPASDADFSARCPDLARFAALAFRPPLLAAAQPATDAFDDVVESLLRTSGFRGTRFCPSPLIGRPRGRCDELPRSSSAGSTPLPRISCLMVTRDRVSLGRRALESFARQSWPNRELVIVTDGEPRFRRTLERYVEALHLDSVKIVVPDDGDRPLGALRNMAMDHCSGEVVCQWDDDDWSHPERLRLQVEYMLHGGAGACVLSEHLQLFEDSQFLAWLDWSRITDHPPAHPGTLMMLRESRFRYPETGPIAIVTYGATGSNATQTPPPQGAMNPPQAGPGSAAVEGDKSCGTQAGRGNAGATGLAGQAGIAGGNGGNSGTVTLTITNMTGTYTLGTYGGPGGQGGTGGQGGVGQIGGAGGSGTSHCDPGPQGAGGNGGQGGTGGSAGNGGTAMPIYITYQTGNPAFASVMTVAGSAGSPGVGGGGGPAGAGNPPGGTGLAGANGATAVPGVAGNVYINGVPQSKST